MIVKFHKKTERIKGLSFHPQQPWLLVGLHSGTIQMIDYRLGRTIEEFFEHEGPVRSVQFHQSLSLFVSGSDDFTVRVWNYKTKKCQFVLRGHLDFVRCVHFHPELPWYVQNLELLIKTNDSNSNRTQSLCDALRISSNKRLSNYLFFGLDYQIMGQLHNQRKDLLRRMQNIQINLQVQNDQQNELELISILEGHNQGVNWCTFSPTENLILSASDDKKVKVWKFYESRGFEVDSYQGHNNNVSSAMFHPFGDYCISNSEDNTIRLWDMKKKCEIDCFTNYELDRFWVSAVHQNNNYFAGGSDSALYIFTLFRNRPAIYLTENKNLYVGSKKQIKLIDLQTSQEKIIKNFQEITSLISDNLLQDNIEFIQQNIYETSKNQLLVRLKQSSHNKQRGICKYVIFECQTNISQIFLGKSAIFIGKSKILKSKENSELAIYNFEVDCHTALGLKAEKVFPYLGGKAIFYTDQIINVFDPVANQVIHQIPCSIEFNNIKQVLSNDTYVMIQTKKSIYLFTKSFQRVTQIQESINIKSVLFLSRTQNSLIYSTKVHIKYLLINGDSGIFGTVETVPYLIQLQQPIDKQSEKYKLFYMNNVGKLLNMSLDCSEMLFKQALMDKNVNYIQNFLKTRKKMGDLITSYLYQKGFSMLAYQLVDDKRAKFQLALSSNNLELSYRTCDDLKNPICYQQLSEEAMRQGNHNIVEVCKQKLRASDELSFLYTITGQNEKLNVLSTIAKEQNEYNTRFQTLLHLGNINQRIQFLQDCKLSHLANLSKLVHGLQYDQKSVIAEDLEWVQSLQPQTLQPPISIIKSKQHPLFSMNWPHNFVDQDQQYNLLIEEDQDTKEKNQKQQEKSSGNQDKQNMNNCKNRQNEQKVDDQQQQEKEEIFEDCQWEINEQELLEMQLNQTNLDFKSLQYGYPDYKKALSPVEQVITEQFQQCQQTLKSTKNVTNLNLCKDYMKQLCLSSIMEITQIPFLQAAPQMLSTLQDKQNFNRNSQNLLKLGYKQTTDGKFQDALNTFKTLLRQALFYEKNTDIVPICFNYIMAMNCELNKKDQSVSRQIELACYMAMCDLQPIHRSLTLRAAMSLAYKHKNHLTGAQVARYLLKLLEKAPQGSAYAKPEVIDNVKKILKNCEQQLRNEYQIDFEEDYLIQGCKIIFADTLTINQEQSNHQCLFDKAIHSQKGKLCKICDLCYIN
ncbi:unnamed protein product (macronuclear) [Paramecium tetraurelia]|uniref:Uncharacterized protein n=1 Tax=Paramecium tetraurelia TaxID=5888 RepID=A0CYP5_PARTE|nr:uncharacterized protein GSPATT00011513001 [Paramecium tetraurelia]CAK75912.1 unnamed protein product [Paramecium tetraurelia]|eukprot:XP_001443309.1 hypothetical protein (macronuclear) [Paramecium tetraurelia strain d4-2]